MTRSESQPAAHTFDAEYAADYDRRTRIGVIGYEALHETAAGLLGASLGEDARVLAVGVGTGEEIVRLGRAHPRWRFTGVDPSPHMLAVARRRIAEAGLDDRTDLVEGTADILPPEPSYDAATLLLVMHFLPDDGSKLSLLRDVGARLRPRAPLVLVDLFGDRASDEFARSLATWQQMMVDAGFPRGEVETRFEHLQRQIAFVPEARITALLREAGLGEPRPFWRALLFGGWLAHRQRSAA